VGVKRRRRRKERQESRNSFRDFGDFGISERKGFFVFFLSPTSRYSFEYSHYSQTIVNA